MMARFSAAPRIRPDASLRRALWVASVIIFWMFAIGIRLVYLQVSRHDSLIERARQQQQDAIETAPQRGQLLDRQGRELARSIETVSIFVDPGELNEADVECLAPVLAAALRTERAALSKQLAAAHQGQSRFVWIARRVTQDVADRVESLGLEKVHLIREPRRFYPNGQLAAHVLGFVGIDGVGLGGLEQFYDEKIAGEPGKLFIEKDSRGRAYESFEIPSKPGQALVLTIDQSLQYRAEYALANAVAQSHARSGTAIVLDPRSGEILALANVPTFDPNSVGGTRAEVRSNWAIQNIYEPGSTFKIVAFSAAIEKGLVKPSDKINCQMGSITVAGRLIHDHHAFGTLTIAEALAKSSNVAAIKLGLRVGDNTMHDYITSFGFGSRTRIELPGETAGLVRPVSRWQPSSIGSIAMGQEIGVTPLQMAAAFGTLANDGIRVAPHLVREIRATTGASVYQANPEQHRVVSVETATALRGMLEGVTLNGTAKKAQLDGYTAAGKTGTAQKIDPKTRAYSHTKHVASFVGFAPVNNPAVVIVVVIDEPGGAYHGGDVAAPVFREIAEQVLPELGVAPDTQFQTIPELIAKPVDPFREREQQTLAEQVRSATLPTVASHDEQDGEVVYAVASHRAILMPDLRDRSVRDVARICAQLGLLVEARGEGQVIRQSPSAGEEVESGQTVYLDFRRVN
jgi:cell division protein FtsI/penicillin-binding protein 2